MVTRGGVLGRIGFCKQQQTLTTAISMASKPLIKEPFIFVSSHFNIAGLLFLMQILKEATRTFHGNE